MDWFTLLLLACATATCSMTFSKSHVARRLREYFEAKRWGVLVELTECPYCLNHWAAGALVWLVGGTVGLREFALLWLATVALATLVVGAMLRLLMLHEHEMSMLRDVIARKNKRIEELKNEKVEQAAEAGQEVP